MAVSINYRCPESACRMPNRLSLPSADTMHACAACGASATLHADPPLVCDGPIRVCLLCGGREFFIRKDFPQKLGLALVILFGVAGSVFYYFENVPATFATLAALVVIDAAIYFFVGKVTVCYRCRAEYRGMVYNPDHKGFDLATSEKYD